MGNKQTWNTHLDKTLKSLNSKVGMMPSKSTPKASTKLKDQLKLKAKGKGKKK